MSSPTLRSVIRWMPAAVLASSAVLAWALFLSGIWFRSVLAWLALQTVLPLLALLVALAVAFVAIRRRRAGRRVWTTLAVAAACVWPAAWTIGVGTMAFPFRLAQSSPSARIRVPTDAAMRVLWGGDDIDHNRHAMMPDQRWAYDLVIEPALTGSSDLASYGCWNVPVVAPTSGRVVQAHDGEPDETPGRSSSNIEKPLGNHVVIELPTGGFLLLAHLQRGSVAVAEGTEVAESTVIGRCGNSGNTSEPHVHIHLQRQDPREYPLNFAEGLPLFFRDHEGVEMPAGGVAWIDGKPQPGGAHVRHRAASDSASTPPASGVVGSAR